MATLEPMATIGFKVPLRVWETWKRLPDSRKQLVKSILMVLLVGVANAEEIDIGCTKEIVLKADESLLKALNGSDGCKEAVRRLYEKLKKGEIRWSEYEALRYLPVWLKPCFE